MEEIDDETKNAINAVSYQEASHYVSWGYEHEILWYGVAAVAHTHLMKRARGVVEGRIPLTELVARYGLNFEDHRSECGFFIHLNKIESDGIFIPNTYWSSEGKKVGTNFRINLFCGDYRNIVWSHNWIDKEYAYKMIDRKWHSRDLKKPSIVEQGIKFGSDMWKVCIKKFRDHTTRRLKLYGDDSLKKLKERFKEAGLPIDEMAVTFDEETNTVTLQHYPKTTDFGERLIKYYSSVVFNLDTTKDVSQIRGVDQ